MQDYLFAVIINGAIILSWLVLFLKNKKKGIEAIHVGIQTIVEMLPMILIIIGIMGIATSFVSPEKVSESLGDRSGLRGFLVISIISSFLQIPGVIAFPIASTLWESGAAVSVVAVFASASTMASILTLPIEMKYLGKKLPIIRIVLTYFVCVAVGLLTGFFYKILI